MSPAWVWGSKLSKSLQKFEFENSKLELAWAWEKSAWDHHYFDLKLSFWVLPSLLQNAEKVNKEVRQEVEHASNIISCRILLKKAVFFYNKWPLKNYLSIIDTQFSRTNIFFQNYIGCHGFCFASKSYGSAHFNEKVNNFVSRAFQKNTKS